MIISGASDDRSDLYIAIDKVIPRLTAEDFELEKQRTTNLTKAGNEHMEQLLGEVGVLTEGSLYEAVNVTAVHHVNQALRAHKLFKRDKDYIVRKGEVVIIDEFTGRMMPGRRYSEGTSSGARSQGACRDPARERDARLDHLPELFPPLRQTRRDDRNGGDRGG